MWVPITANVLAYYMSHHFCIHLIGACWVIVCVPALAGATLEVSTTPIPVGRAELTHFRFAIPEIYTLDRQFSDTLLLLCALAARVRSASGQHLPGFAWGRLGTVFLLRQVFFVSKQCGQRKFISIFTPASRVV